MRRTCSAKTTANVAARVPAGRRLLAEALPLWKRAQADTERLLTHSPDRLRAALRALS